MPLRNAVMKRHRWGEDPGADMVQTGKLIGQGIGKLGALVKHRAATRRLPENLARLAAAIEEFRPARKYDYEFPYQIELTGFEMAEVDFLLDEATEIKQSPLLPEDSIPELSAEPPVTKLGDLWLLGAHRLYCGDARDERAYETLMKGTKADFVFRIRPTTCRSMGTSAASGASGTETSLWLPAR